MDVSAPEVSGVSSTSSPEGCSWATGLALPLLPAWPPLLAGLALPYFSKPPILSEPTNPLLPLNVSASPLRSPEVLQVGHKGESNLQPSHKPP